MSKKKFFCKLIVRVSPIDSPGHPSFKSASSPMQTGHAIGPMQTGHQVQLKYSDIMNHLNQEHTEKDNQKNKEENKQWAPHQCFENKFQRSMILHSLNAGHNRPLPTSTAEGYRLRSQPRRVRVKHTRKKVVRFTRIVPAHVPHHHLRPKGSIRKSKVVPPDFKELEQGDYGSHGPSPKGSIKRLQDAQDASLYLAIDQVIHEAMAQARRNPPRPRGSVARLLDIGEQDLQELQWAEEQDLQEARFEDAEEQRESEIQYAEQQKNVCIRRRPKGSVGRLPGFTQVEQQCPKEPEPEAAFAWLQGN